MTNSIRDITEESNCIFVIGSNTTEQHPVIGIKVRAAKRRRGAKLIVADPREIDLADYADLHLQHKPGTDIALLNGLMYVIMREGWHDEEFIAERTENFEAMRRTVGAYPPDVVSQITGVPAEDIEKAARILAENRPGALLYCMGITQHTTGVDNVMSVANLQMLLGNIGVPGAGVNPLRGQNNVQGACDMGNLPNVYAGYQSVTDPAVQDKFERAWGVPLSNEVGLTITELLDAAAEGTIRCLYIIGENPMTSDPDLDHVHHDLEETAFLVHQDLFLNETGRMADVVLPAASFAEKDGTFTNTERRVQRVRQAIEPVGQSKDDAWIVTQLARRLFDLGAASPHPEASYSAWDYSSVEDVMAEINALAPIYGGVTYQRLNDGEQLQWPVPTEEHPGTPILHVGRFSRGVGRFAAVDHRPPAEVPDEEYPLMLTTGCVLYHWHSGTLTHHARNLEAMYPEARIEINPADAHEHGISDEAMVRVASRRGEIVAKAQVTERVPSGLVFATFHFEDSDVNYLTNPALDPVAKIPEYKVCAVNIEAVDDHPEE